MSTRTPATSGSARRARSGRWTDADGTGRIDIRGPVDLTARIIGRIEPFERELFDEARADGRRERSDALSFDAMVAWADAPVGSCAGRAVREHVTVVRIDHAALVRGSTRAG